MTTNVVLNVISPLMQVIWNNVKECIVVVNVAYHIENIHLTSDFLPHFELKTSFQTYSNFSYWEIWQKPSFQSPKGHFQNFGRVFTLKMCPKTATALQMFMQKYRWNSQYCMEYLSKEICINEINNFQGFSIVTSTAFSYNLVSGWQKGRFF